MLQHLVYTRSMTNDICVIHDRIRLKVKNNYLHCIAEDIPENEEITPREVKIKIRDNDCLAVEIDGKGLRARQLKLPVFTTEKVMWIFGWGPKDKFHPKKYKELRNYAAQQAKEKNLEVIELNIQNWASFLSLSNGEKFGYQILKGKENPDFEEVRKYLNSQIVYADAKKHATFKDAPEIFTKDDPELTERINFVLAYLDRIEKAQEINKRTRKNNRTVREFLKGLKEEHSSDHLMVDIIDRTIKRLNKINAKTRMRGVPQNNKRAAIEILSKLGEKYSVKLKDTVIRNQEAEEKIKYLISKVETLVLGGVKDEPK